MKIGTSWDVPKDTYSLTLADMTPAELHLFVTTLNGALAYEEGMLADLNKKYATLMHQRGELWRGRVDPSKG